MPRQVPETQLVVELHLVARLHRRVDEGRIDRREHFRWPLPGEVGRQLAVVVRRADGEIAGGEIQRREGPAGAHRLDAGQYAVPIRRKEIVFRQRAGRDDPLHAPPHRPFGGGRIADLLADGHGAAFLHQLGKVAVHRMERHAGHRNGLASRTPARREGDVQQAGGLFGIVVEQLVEIAHAVEEKRIWMLRLDAQILLHHGRVAGNRHSAVA